MWRPGSTARGAPVNFLFEGITYRKTEYTTVCVKIGFWLHMALVRSPRRLPKQTQNENMFRRYMVAPPLRRVVCPRKSLAISVIFLSLQHESPVAHLSCNIPGICALFGYPPLLCQRVETISFTFTWCNFVGVFDGCRPHRREGEAVQHFRRKHPPRVPKHLRRRREKKRARGDSLFLRRCHVALSRQYAPVCQASVNKNETCMLFPYHNKEG